MEVYGDRAECFSIINKQAATLVRTLAEAYNSDGNFGSFCTVPYDTAWVSMVQKDSQWLFPESFRCLSDMQHQDGGWYSGTDAAQVDVILNTLASLLAFKMYKAEPLNVVLPIDMDDRISKATNFLQRRIEKWDIASSTHVGFEILVPALLELLENEGTWFDVPNHSLLSTLNRKKMKHFNPAMLYGTQQVTLLHSLEAFIGRVDFDKLSHHKIFGSMMASPASTAAYLMNSSRWDEESECYLRMVLSHGYGKGDGGLPSAYPTQIFEFSWVLSTLLLSGFTTESLGSEHVATLCNFLESQICAMNGLSGFAPQIQADADDTAKCILTLNLSGKTSSPHSLVSQFQSQSHFRTYAIESNPSFSANCNILCTLLYLQSPSEYAPEIYKATEFVCDLWWKGDSKDKWNISKQYPMMLLSQALMRLLRLLDSGTLEMRSLFKEKVPIVLFQVLVQTLRSQNQDGYWGNRSQEESAYSILTLVYLEALPWANTLSGKIHKSIAKGRLFLSCTDVLEHKPDVIWIEKVSYSSEILCQTYCLAALRAPFDDSYWTNIVFDLISIPSRKVEGFFKLFATIPLFSTEPEWKLRASIIEGFLFLPLLRQSAKTIFSREERASDQYLEYIPLTWTATNNLQSVSMCASFIQEMMVLSMLNFQADEYMESVVGERFQNNLEPIKQLILTLCAPSTPINGFNGESRGFENTVANGKICNGHQSNENASDGFGKLSKGIQESELQNLHSIKHTLGKFVQYVLNHPTVERASDYDKSFLKQELRSYLLAHVTQLEDNALFSKGDRSEDKTTQFTGRDVTYYKWVHTTSAEHSSCPYSFAYVLCLTSIGNLDCLPGMVSKYISQDLCYHLAAMCRQYNDFGSVKRDREEKNLNSVNFVEFHAATESEADLKDSLFRVAEYERENMLFVIERLERVLPSHVTEMLRLFVDVTDLYGQIYVARDIGIKSTNS